MRLLIDSHTLVWWSSGSTSPSVAARDATGGPLNDVMVSVVALWELTIREASGKLSLPADLETTVMDEGDRFCSPAAPRNPAAPSS